jgi:hypothetical protein
VCHSPGVLSGQGCPGAGALRELPLAEAASGILAAANGARPVHRPSHWQPQPGLSTSLAGRGSSYHAPSVPVATGDLSLVNCIQLRGIMINAGQSVKVTPPYLDPSPSVSSGLRRRGVRHGCHSVHNRHRDSGIAAM